MKAYRIYTEDKNQIAILAVASTYFDSFTVFNNTGYWRGIAEPSVCIEVIDLEDTLDLAGKIKLFAQEVKSFNKQEAVLITESTVNAELI